jgi:hypothetical protein
VWKDSSGAESEGGKEGTANQSLGLSGASWRWEDEKERGVVWVKLKQRKASVDGRAERRLVDAVALTAGVGARQVTVEQVKGGRRVGADGAGAFLVQREGGGRYTEGEHGSGDRSTVGVCSAGVCRAAGSLEEGVSSEVWRRAWLALDGGELRVSKDRGGAQQWRC